MLTVCRHVGLVAGTGPKRRFWEISPVKSRSRNQRNAKPCARFWPRAGKASAKNARIQHMGHGVVVTAAQLASRRTPARGMAPCVETAGTPRAAWRGWGPPATPPEPHDARLGDPSVACRARGTARPCRPYDSGRAARREGVGFREENLKLSTASAIVRGQDTNRGQFSASGWLSM